MLATGIKLYSFDFKSVTSGLAVANKLQYSLPSLIEHKQCRKWTGRFFSNKSCFKIYGQSITVKPGYLLTRTYFFYSYFNEIDSPVKGQTVYTGRWPSYRGQAHRNTPLILFLVYPASHVTWESSFSTCWWPQKLETTRVSCEDYDHSLLLLLEGKCDTPRSQLSLNSMTKV